MNRFQQWMSSAVGVVLLIVVSSNLLLEDPIPYEGPSEHIALSSESLETLIATDYPAEFIRYGASVEVHRFDLNAGFPYTLRYLSFETEVQDLEIGNWEAYSVVDGRVNYSDQVGQGETWRDGLLKIRFFEDRARGYFGEGLESFAIVADVKRAGENPALRLEQANSDNLEDFFQWAWMEGHQNHPWWEL